MSKQEPRGPPPPPLPPPYPHQKLFKKCKSATFQLDGATYTIVLGSWLIPRRLKDCPRSLFKQKTFRLAQKRHSLLMFELSDIYKIPFLEIVPFQCKCICTSAYVTWDSPRSLIHEQSLEELLGRGNAGSKVEARRKYGASEFLRTVAATDSIRITYTWTTSRLSKSLIRSVTNRAALFPRLCMNSQR
ncbi:uncharacterized protein LOC143177331 [Calliopsis andreniformis]|uniref:uncharacterized protein LOC143177331 n=1 Tax=Calliopsis andreniformis TaxID=337506 RepID=UPI003FCDBEFA